MPRRGAPGIERCELDGQTAVAKIIDSDKINDEMTYLLTNECTIWSRLSHPNIVSLHHVAASSRHVLLWMDCCDSDVSSLTHQPLSLPPLTSWWSIIRW